MSKLEKIILDNGLNIFLINDNTKHTTYINLIVKYGGIDNIFLVNDKKYKMRNGLAHFIEHLVLESSIYGDLMKNFGKIGIRSNGMTSIDRTQYYIDVVDHIYDGLKVLIKGIHSPIISKDVVENIKKPILEEKRRSLDNKYSVLYNKSLNAIMDNRKFSSVLGDMKDIERISEHDVKTSFNAFYRPDNEVIVIGGQFDKNTIINTIKEAYNSLEFNNDDVIKYREKHKKEVNIKKSKVFSNTGINRTVITFKLDTIKYSSKEKLDLDLYLFSFLRMNFGIISDISKKLIDKKIINGGIGHSCTLFEGYNIFRIEADTDNKEEFVKEILDYLEEKKYKFDKELFLLYQRNYVIDLIIRNDNIYDMVDPLIENIVSFDYHKLDSIEDLNNMSFEEFEKCIKSLDFSNYSILELNSK